MLKKYNILNILIIIYFILKPIYIFKSGVPQPADIVIIIAFVISIFKIKGLIYKPCNKVIVSFISFIFYIFFVNCIWAFNDNINANTYLKSIVFYIFNLIAIITISNIYALNKDKKNFFVIITEAIFASIIIQIIFLKDVDINTRNIGFFNNPNQLAYYGLLMFILAYILRDIFKKKI